MQLNSSSFSSGRAPRPSRPKPKKDAAPAAPDAPGTPAAPAGPRMNVRRGVWLAVAVLLLVGIAGSMQSWFVEQPEPVQTSFVRKPAKRTGVDMKTRIKSLFGPRPGQRLNG